MAGDRLAQEIEAAGIAHLVDRQQLHHLLRERELAAEPSPPMLSYDAMVRLEIDAGRLAPESVLSVIDLSTGNVLEQETLGWPLREADVSPMLALCRKALKGVGRPAAGKLRVLAAAGDRTTSPTSKAGDRR